MLGNHNANKQAQHKQKKHIGKGNNKAQHKQKSATQIKEMRNGRENLKDNQSENVSKWMFTIPITQEGGIFQ